MVSNCRLEFEKKRDVLGFAIFNQEEASKANEGMEYICDREW